MALAIAPAISPKTIQAMMFHISLTPVSTHPSFIQVQSITFKLVIPSTSGNNLKKYERNN
ncbi:hypothetical protein DSM107010_23850 [Chroococcidiopsis cubana SAG 39.79]|uniref:Uncharacterized protein n=1 Tax=Chroococcidiopsis cubana SAG 39.79 TaxID=388085 RepID=A0AB37ULX1_9CYAN|nr:hypothetical protein DSM107010_23850 [Chroococcidiopsis cubana SAG 39.79]